MIRLVVLFLSLTISLYCFSANKTDSLILELNNTIDKRDDYVKEKLDNIKKLTSQLYGHRNTDEKAFTLSNEIYNQYKSFVYDSAFSYAIRLQKIAARINDPVKISRAKLNIGFVLFSSGMFKEAIDTFKSLNVQHLTDTMKIEYYGNFARLYYDIASYDLDKLYSPKYDVIGNKYIDSALNICQPTSFAFLTLSGLKMMKGQDFNSALPYFEHLLKNYKLNYSQYAIATSSLAYIYLRKQNMDKAMQLLVNAAIADIKSSTKETVAIRNLAEILYKQGKVKEALHYIKIAMDEANFYNARHRKNQIASILPMIEEHELTTVENQKRQIFNYAKSVSVLSILVVFSLILIIIQLKKIGKAKMEISKTNAILEQTNVKLLEANKIKEEYIGYYFNITSENITRLENSKKALSRLVNLRRFDDVEALVNNINPKKEREELYGSFDKIFLKLFPGFIETFNSYFKDEDKIETNEKQLLPNEVRIFALMRLGINDNEKIARILNYSVHTVYAYKTKIKTKSILPNEQFEEKIMEIKSVEVNNR